jgi:hypothetical protein
MKHRSVGKVLLLSIVTLGIYRLYWFAKTRQEMMSLNRDIKIPHIVWYIAPLVFVVAAVIFFIASGALAKDEAQAMTGVQIAALVVFYGAIFLVAPLTAIWLWKYSQGVETVTDEKMNFAVAMLILLAVPDGIDILIVQDAFNKVAHVAEPVLLQHTDAPVLPNQ